MGKIFTNKIIYEINYQKLISDYNVFSIVSSYENVLTAISKHENLLKNTLSYLFQDYKTVYCLLPKSFSMSQLMFDNNIIVKKEDCTKMNGDIVLNLILYMHTKENGNVDDIISNVHGQYFLYIPDKRIEKKEQILTINPRFIEKNKQIYLNADLVTFTKYSLFDDSERSRYKLYTKPKYQLTPQRTFIRTNSKDEESVYIKRKKYNKDKNTITEFHFDKNKFRQTRTYAYYRIYEILNQSEYVNHINFIEEEFQDIEKLKETDTSKDIVFTASNLFIINATNNQELTNALVNSIKENIESTVINSITTLSFDENTKQQLKNDNNIENRYIIIIDDSTKENNQFHHQINIVKQCITVDSFDTKPSLCLNESVCKNLFIQLEIKYNLFVNKINFVNKMNKTLDFQTLSALRIDYENDVFHCITINTNGDIISTLYNQPKSYLKRTNKKMWDTWSENEYSDTKQSNEFILIDETIFELSDFGYKTIPNIKLLSKRLNEGNNFTAPIHRHIETIEKIMTKTTPNLLGYEAIKNYFYDKNIDITIKDFINEIKSNCKTKTIKNGVEKTTTNVFADKLIDYYDNLGIYRHEPFRRNNKILQNMLGCYNLSGLKIKENKLYFFIQPRNPSTNPKPNVQNANVIHCIQNTTNETINENHKNILIQLLCVTFVKMDCYSTKPFLFKYLDEIENIEKEKEE